MCLGAGASDSLHDPRRLPDSSEKHSPLSPTATEIQQAAAYILMLNTGLRTGELLGLLNSDIDLERRVLHLERGVKEVCGGTACKPSQVEM